MFRCHKGRAQRRILAQKIPHGHRDAWPSESSSSTLSTKPSCFGAVQDLPPKKSATSSVANPSCFQSTDFSLLSGLPVWLPPPHRPALILDTCTRPSAALPSSKVTVTKAPKGAVRATVPWNHSWRYRRKNEELTIHQTTNQYIYIYAIESHLFKCLVHIWKARVTSFQIFGSHLETWKLKHRYINYTNESGAIRCKCSGGKDGLETARKGSDQQRLYNVQLQTFRLNMVI